MCYGDDAAWEWKMEHMTQTLIDAFFADAVPLYRGYTHEIMSEDINLRTLLRSNVADILSN